MATRPVPRSWTQMRSWEQLQRWRTKGGLIVILDDYTESHYHAPDCDSIAQRHFEEKRSNAWKNGAYYWIKTAAEAAGYAVVCDNCGGRASEHRS